MRPPEHRWTITSNIELRVSLLIKYEPHPDFTPRPHLVSVFTSNAKGKFELARGRRFENCRRKIP